MNDIPIEIVRAAVDAAVAGGCDIADLALDTIARQAGISRSTLYRRIGSREALIEAARAGGVAVAERPDVRERAVAAAAEHPALLRALLADVLARPDASPARYLIGTYLPRLLDSAGRWLAEEVAAGRCRPLPLPLLLQLLGGPMLLHVVTRDAFEHAGGLLPSREDVIDELTEAYYRAVALVPDDQPGPDTLPQAGGLDRSRQG
ncbi:MAG: TetR family transcriptional regulator [Chloroflexi bacterium]|nr:TetR family transcriptional regulator [Chloroflexota bacterium]